MKRLIFLASPYTHPDPAVREARYLGAVAAVARYMKEGFHVYSPIAHSHPAAVEHELPTDKFFWESFNANILGRCDEVWVLKLPGWADSAGVQGEISLAQRLGKPVEYVSA